MNIACLIPFRPWPKVSGTVIRISEIIKALSDRHTLSLFYISETPMGSGCELKQYAGFTKNFPPASAEEAPVAALGRPVVDRFRRYRRKKDLARRITCGINEARPDLLLMFGTTSLQFLDFQDLAVARVAVDEGFLEHLRLLRQYVGERKFTLRIRYLINYWMLKRYESKLSRRVDLHFAVTRYEERYLRQALGVRDVIYLPCGANPDYLCPLDRKEPSNGKVIMFCGDLYYEPNRQAVQDLVELIMPAVFIAHPDAVLRIVGRFREDDFNRLPGDPRIVFTGFVERLKDEYCKTAVFVSPVWVGRGFITKVLDAFAAGLPVVTPTFIVDGEGPIDGVHYLGANSFSDFQKAINQLLSDDQRRRVIAANARSFALSRPWEETLKPLGRIGDRYD